MNKQLIMGVFDSERFWRDEAVAALPGVYDRSGARIVGVMDELLFPFCGKDDVLITARKMNEAHREYLAGIGFCFGHNDIDLVEADGAGNEMPNVFLAALQSRNLERLKALVDADTRLSPYAVISPAKEMCSALSVQYRLPELDRVKTANSKIYSNELRIRLGLPGAGEVVHDSAELADKGRALLARGAFLVKDEYGVSGKGNLLIGSEAVLLRIVRYLKRQEENRKRVRLLIEPLLSKKSDFSCSIVSDARGNIRIESVQRIMNQGFNYAGTVDLEDEARRTLDASGYFRTMETVAGELYRDGYYGELGVDSMILDDGNIVPVIEINARKTMGMVNKRVNLFLDQFDLDGQLALCTVGYADRPDFRRWLAALDEAKLLFRCGMSGGIIPLSANTLLVNGDGGGRVTDGTELARGRFYYSAAAATAEERNSLIRRTGGLFQSCGFRIY